MREERLFLWGLKKKFSEPVDDISALFKFDVATTIDSSHDQYLQSIGFPGNFRAVDVQHGMKMQEEERVQLNFGSKMGMKKGCQRFGISYDSLRPVQEVNALHTERSVALNIASNPDLLDRIESAFRTL